MGPYLRSFVMCIMTAPFFTCGCSQFQTKSKFAQANDLFHQGSYQASLETYDEIIAKAPATGDRALFEKGVIYAHPKNGQKDYQRSLECFQKIMKDYPASGYRQDSERMIFYLNNVAIKETIISSQQQQIEALRHEVAAKSNDLAALQQKIESLEKKLSTLALQKGSADRILIEKKARRLTLLSKGEVLKTYRIALGGNPNGPKERQGDNRTPEGTYTIDSRNKDSQYHLSLHVSYPNERDKRRAKELGVSPGGNIMIHGIKNGLSWVGDSHTEVDWTKGCIAVTDEEIEEIARVVPNGTAVEIRP